MNLWESTPQPHIRVLLIAGPDTVGDWMASVINAEPSMTFLGLVRNLSQAHEAVDKLKPDVVLLDIGSGILQHGDLINRLSAPLSGPALIVVALMGEVEAVRQAMLSGAQGFLLKPFSEDELRNSVRQAYNLTRQRRAELSEIPRLPAGREAPPSPKAEIIGVFSPKGGVGCTTVAVNLAIALGITTDKSVILVDGDLRFGDIDTVLNITTTTTLGTLLPYLDELDNHILERALTNHESGIRVLVAPPFLDAADTIKPEQLSQLLARLSALGEGYIVIDLWSSLDEYTLSFLDACQRLVVVTTPQITALRDTHRFLDVLKLLRFDPERTSLVLNHCYGRSNIKLKEVERALGQPIVQTIEYAPNQVTASLNRGVPLLQEYRDSPAAQNILQLARQITNQSVKRERPSLEIQPTRVTSERSNKRGLFFRRQVATGDKVKP